MTERVAQAPAGIRWQPNSPAAVLIVTDAGLAALAPNPYPADSDHDCVFIWSGAAGDGDENPER